MSSLRLFYESPFRLPWCPCGVWRGAWWLRPWPPSGGPPPGSGSRSPASWHSSPSPLHHFERNLTQRVTKMSFAVCKIFCGNSAYWCLFFWIYFSKILFRNVKFFSIKLPTVCCILGRFSLFSDLQQTKIGSCNYFQKYYGHWNNIVPFLHWLFSISKFSTVSVPRAQKKKTNALQVPPPRWLSWPCVSDLHLI